MSSSPLFRPNSALLQDELLLELVKVLDHGYPAGPSFLHALNTIAEASVLHQSVYFDPAGEATVSMPGRARNIIADSPFVAKLHKQGVLERFPDRSEVDEYLGGTGSGYTYLDFISDYVHTLHTFSFNDPKAEEQNFKRLAFLVANYPGVFAQKTLLDHDDQPVGAESVRLATAGMPVENLLYFEGLNHKVAALLDSARHLSLNVYLVNTAVPHQFGAIGRINGRARALYEKLEGQLEDSDDVGDDAYDSLEVPPLGQLVMERCEGDPNALAAEIVALRDRHRRFRDYLTKYDVAWADALTKHERIRLQADFDHAWASLVEGERAPRDRLIYKLWDVVKRPTQVLTRVGDKLVSRGRKEVVVGQVRGLRAFWKDLLDSPVHSRNWELVKELFPNRAPSYLWDAAREYSSAVAKTERKGAS